MRSFVVIASLLCVCACVRSTDATPIAKGPSAEEIQQRLLRISEAALAAKKSTDTSTLPWESLATMLPDTIGKLTAAGPVTGHVDATGTQISKAKRSYVNAGQTANIELMDVARAPNVLFAFMLQRGAVQQPARPDENGTIAEAVTVGEYPALTRFSATTQQAIVTLAVKQRFVIEVRLTPTTSAEEAARVMGALPLADVAILAATNPGPASAPSVAVPAAKTAIDDDDPDQP